MKINKKTILIYGLILLVIVIGIWYLKYKPFVNQSVGSNDNQQFTGWNIYRNEKLGFEIKYPKETFVWEGKCELKEGKNISTYGTVPIKIFENGNEVYIANEYLYEETEGSCVKVNNPFPIIKDRRWKIIVRDNIKSDSDLSEFVSEYFGPDNKCDLGEKKPFRQANVYEVYPKWDGKDLGESECFINYGAVILYSPAKGKIVAWETGQEPKFWGDQEGNITYDQEMIDSFRFID